MSKKSTAMLVCLFLLVLSPPLWSQQPISTLSATWSDAEKETFLLTAKVVKTRKVSTSITGTRRATLFDGSVTHDASVQSIDVFKATYTTPRGRELNFRDSYKYNIAAYRLDRLLNLHMIPVSVKRKIKRKKAAVTWWVDQVKMMERARYEQKIKAPNLAQWNDQMYQVRIFNELVYNTDPNLGNLLITEDWKLVMIDFTRAFRWHKELRSPENLKNCKLDRRFYDGMRQLSQEVVKQRLGDALTSNEIKGVMARREKILKHFDAQIAERGERLVICSLPGH